MRSLSLLLLVLLSGAPALAKGKPPIVHRIPLPPKPDFSALEWLAGTWKGQTIEHSPAGEISLAVSFDLDMRLMIFREQSSLSATTTLPETKEMCLGILNPDRSGRDFVLRLFSDTGFVTRYRVTVDGGEISFSPEGGEQPPPGWLFRRQLQRTGANELLEAVQVAPPGKPFFEYYTAKLTRNPTQ
jgi:hypothetical protein